MCIFFSNTVLAPWKPTAAFQRDNAEAHNWRTDSWTIDSWRNVKNVTLETSSLEFSRRGKQPHCITRCSYTLAVVGGGRNCSFTVSAGCLSPHTTPCSTGQSFPSALLNARVTKQPTSKLRLWVQKTKGMATYVGTTWQFLLSSAQSSWNFLPNRQVSHSLVPNVYLHLPGSK